MDFKLWGFRFLAIIIAYAGITILHLVFSVKRTIGYVKDDRTGELLNYRINVIMVLPSSILA